MRWGMPAGSSAVVDPASDKILGLQRLQAVRSQLREAGQVVVQCHGCFDIVHPGHIRYLRFARQQGDILMVSVSADDVVGKGFDRPYINQDLRLENLAALESVDYVVLDHNTWAGPILEALKPDVYIKGKEYETNADPRFLRERELVEGHGGRVIFSSGDVVFSSSAIIQRFSERFDLEHERVAFFCRHHGIDLESLERPLLELSGKRVVVLGDPILDRYVHCEKPAVASEAPVLSVRPVGEQWYLGGPGLICAQLAALGARAHFLSPRGDGPHTDRFDAAVRRFGVHGEWVPAPRRPIYVKTRYLVEAKKVFKIDEGNASSLDTATVDLIQARLDQLLEQADALVVTDFGLGLFGSHLNQVVHELAERHEVPYFADVSRRGEANILQFHEPFMATPTEDELRFAFGDRDSGLSNLAAKYYEQTGARSLVLTLGPRGVIYFHPPAGERLRTDFLPALNPRPLDEVGAGDCFLSGMVAGSVAGASPQTSLFLAMALAAVHVSRLGNDPVPVAALQRFLSTEMGPALSWRRDAP